LRWPRRRSAARIQLTSNSRMSPCRN
jgi:hypothetical protein